MVKGSNCVGVNWYWVRMLSIRAEMVIFLRKNLVVNWGRGEKASGGPGKGVELRRGLRCQQIEKK